MSGRARINPPANRRTITIIERDNRLILISADQLIIRRFNSPN